MAQLSFKSCWAKPLEDCWLSYGDLMLIKDAFYSNIDFILVSMYINLALSFFEKLRVSNMEY